MRCNRKAGALSAVASFLVLILQLMGVSLLALALCGFRWPFGPEGPAVFGVPVFLVGLPIGAVLAILLPYIKSGLQKVRETGNWVDMPRFDWRYAALILLPLVEFGASFLITPGLWEGAHSWTLVHSVLLAYTGADLPKQVSKAGIGLYNALTKSLE